MFLSVFYTVATVLWCITLITAIFLCKCFDKVEKYAIKYTHDLACLWTLFWFLVNAIVITIQPYIPRLSAKEALSLQSILFFIIEVGILVIVIKLIDTYILPKYLVPFLNKRATKKNLEYVDNGFDTDKKLVAKDDNPDEIYEEVKEKTVDKDYDKKLDERIKKYQSDK